MTRDTTKRTRKIHKRGYKSAVMRVRPVCDSCGMPTPPNALMTHWVVGEHDMPERRTYCLYCGIAGKVLGGEAWYRVTTRLRKAFTGIIGLALRDQMSEADVMTAIDVARNPPLVGSPAGMCRVCGCDDLHACEGGCFWVEADLCSACAGIGIKELARIANNKRVELKTGDRFLSRAAGTVVEVVDVVLVGARGPSDRGLVRLRGADGVIRDGITVKSFLHRYRPTKMKLGDRAKLAGGAS